MKAKRLSLAAPELLLIFPGALFMGALFVRNLQPPQYEPARTAQRIVDWYAAQPRLGLWVFLIALPLVVLIAGSAILVRAWRSDDALRVAARAAAEAVRGNLAMVLVAGATVISAAILGIVGLHLITG